MLSFETETENYLYI